jgi:hypothetical protein
MGSSYRYRSLTPPESPDAKQRAAKVRTAAAAKEADTATEALDTSGSDAGELGGPGGGEVSATEGDGAPMGPRRQARRASQGDEQEEVEGMGVGWPDGVGDGRPFEVPITLDYFQGFLVQAGVPTTAVPRDGRTLSPQQAVELVPHLLSTPVTLGLQHVRAGAGLPGPGNGSAEAVVLQGLSGRGVRGLRRV